MLLALSAVPVTGTINGTRDISVYKTRSFARFADKEHLDDDALAQAADAVAADRADADLGGGVYKVRVARRSGGKSGGYRIIVLSRHGDRYVLVAGFAKSARANIDDDELREFRKLARAYAAYSTKELAQAVENGALMEVIRDEEEDDDAANER